MNQTMDSASSTKVPRAPGGVLSSQLVTLRRRHVGVAVLTGLSILVVIGVELLALALFVDWWVELPWALRLVSILVQGAVATYLLLTMVITPLVRQPDEDELALMVERARPEFRSRLIAAIQLARSGSAAPNTSTAMVSALVHETEQLAAAMDFRHVVPVERIKMFGAMALAVIVLMTAGMFAGRDTCGVLLRRWMLSSEPVPRKTRIVVPEGEKLIGIGDNVRLETFVQGIVPRSGKVEVKGRTRRAQEFPLEQNRENNIQFGRTLENVQEDFTYQFTLGDGVSPAFQVRAVPRPTVASMECVQEFPAYTGLKPMTRSLGDLSLLAGSVLEMKVAATKDLSYAEARLVGVQSNVVLRRIAGGARSWIGEVQVPAKGLTGFQIQMIDSNGMESRDSAVYRVDVLPDKLPVVRLTHPDRKEELVTKQAALLIGFEVTDDFQVAKLRLKYRVVSVEGDEPKALELDMESARTAKLRRRFEWKISEVLPGLPESSVVEYWVEAEDNNNGTGPGVGSSERQLLKIVSDSEKRADLLNRASDYLGSINDVVTDQEKLNQNLGAIIRAKAGLR
ncbi:MAG: hypothetical protein IPK15_07440 [Verrucomicrobia bacterium]|nr:hypothetical protein [Verrucomicrobiota bacterium]